MLAALVPVSSFTLCYVFGFLFVLFSLTKIFQASATSQLSLDFSSGHTVLLKSTKTKQLIAHKKSPPNTYKKKELISQKKEEKKKLREKFKLYTMITSPLAPFLLLASPFVLHSTYALPLTNNINCNSLPITINTPTVLSEDLNFSHCLGGNGNVLFKVSNDATFDCNGHAITGSGGRKTIRVIGGATIMNCHIKNDETGVSWVTDNSESSELTIKNSAFSDVWYAIDIEGSNADAVNVNVEDCEITNVKYVGMNIVRAAATVHIKDTVMTNGKYAISTYSVNTKASLMNIQNTKFSGFDVALGIGQPTNMVNITNVEMHDGGIYFNNDVDDISISDTNIINSTVYSGIYFSKSGMYPQVELKDVSVCGTKQPHPDLEWQNIHNIKVTTGSDLTCDKVIEFGTDVTSTYCSKACSPVSFFFSLSPLPFFSRQLQNSKKHCYR